MYTMYTYTCVHNVHINTHIYLWWYAGVKKVKKDQIR